MYVPSYQIHNVLRVYSRQLTRTSAQGVPNLEDESRTAGNLGIAGSGKRAAVLQRISSDIVKKMTKAGTDKEPDSLSEFPASPAISSELAGGSDAEDRQHVFAYNIIEKDLCKQGQKISETSSRQLMDRLNVLAEKRTPPT